VPETLAENSIYDLLMRRTDLSAFIVHLTRDSSKHSAKNNLKRILRTKVLEARSSFGPAKDVPGKRNRDSQKCVSFSEVPVTHILSLTGVIPKRQVQLSSYGIVFTKMRMRERGANPVWYLDITPNHHEWLTKSVNRMVEVEVKKSGQKFFESDVANICPFIEQMGSGLRKDGYGYRKEFWWEREWRHRGDFNFSYTEVAFGLAPEEDVNEFEDFMRRRRARTSRKVRFLAPNWSLDKAIAHMCGCAGALTPFDPADL
jgi:hypothetical protein